MNTNEPQVYRAAAPEIGQTVYRNNPYSWTHSQVSVAQSKNAAATVMTYRHNPYDNTNSKVFLAQPTSDADTGPMALTFDVTNSTIVLSEGLVLYAAKSEPAAPYDGPTETIVVGCVPHGMKAARVRWVVQRVTGVAPISIREGRSGSDRRPSGLFFMKVRQDDVDHILSRSGCALCLQSALWAPQDGMYDVEKVATELKAHGHVRTMALKFEKMKANAL
jgi:hypothetical protein